MTELRHRVKKYTPATLHETTCRSCRKPFLTRGTGQQCRACWRKHHQPKRRPKT